MAALMVGALDHPEITKDHVKSKFPQNFTQVARTLQQDPSCQLLTVLRKYLLLEGARKFEPFLQEGGSGIIGPPDTETLQKGIIALTREWKNKLTTAMLESSVKSSSSKSSYDRRSRKLLKKVKVVSPDEPNVEINVDEQLEDEQLRYHHLRNPEDELHEPVGEEVDDSDFSYATDEKAGLLPGGLSGLFDFKSKQSGYATMPSSREDLTGYKRSL